MATRIALISANRHKEPYPVYPLGTAYLKGYLLKKLSDCEVDVLDMNLLSVADLQQYISQQMPDYICVSLRNVDGANSLDKRGFLQYYKRLVDSIRLKSDAPLIIGGSGLSIFPDIFFYELNADYAITGEGENALCDLIEALRNGNEITHIPKLYSMNSVNTSQCKFISAPSAYYEPKLIEYYWKQSGMLNIQTKRGCPYNCIYCTYPLIDGTHVRTMDIDSIVETIAKSKQDYGINYWFVTDSVFNIKNSFNISFAEELIRRNLNISWGAYFSPSNITRDQMSVYKQSGLTHIEFGTESFCDETLQDYGKRFTFNDVINTSELALEHNVFYSHFLILGGWGETKEQLLQTIDNSKHLKYTVIFPYVGMRIYPNTSLYTKALKEGIIEKENDLIEPAYYLRKDFDLEATRKLALETKKAWIFPDQPQDKLVETLKLKRNKKGPLWEYLRKP